MITFTSIKQLDIRLIKLAGKTTTATLNGYLANEDGERVSPFFSVTVPSGEFKSLQSLIEFDFPKGAMFAFVDLSANCAVDGGMLATDNVEAVTNAPTLEAGYGLVLGGIPR